MSLVKTCTFAALLWEGAARKEFSADDCKSFLEDLHATHKDIGSIAKGTSAAMTRARGKVDQRWVQVSEATVS